MPRPSKSRRISRYPEYWRFGPEEGAKESITLSLDEYETIRLIDWKGYTQEEAAAEMQVSRTTVTSIYDAARKKLADALVNGRELVITGGRYRLAPIPSIQFPKKGENCMRIAVTYDNGQIFQHFGRTSQFKLYDSENGKIVHEEVIDTNGTGHGALAGFLKQAGADVLICGGLGGGALMAMQEAGIPVYAGNSGLADKAVETYLAGNLARKEEASCHHKHGNEGHCGGHCGH